MSGTERRIVAVWLMALVTVFLVAISAVVSATPKSGPDWWGIVVMVLAVSGAAFYERNAR